MLSTFNACCETILVLFQQCIVLSTVLRDTQWGKNIRLILKITTLVLVTEVILFLFCVGVKNSWCFVKGFLRLLYFEILYLKASLPLLAVLKHTLCFTLCASRFRMIKCSYSSLFLLPTTLLLLQIVNNFKIYEALTILWKCWKQYLSLSDIIFCLLWTLPYQICYIILTNFRHD